MGGISIRGKALVIALACAVLVPIGLAVPASAGSITYVVRGGGWGHGLGLSQWGAKGYADMGWTAGAIVKRFYSGTSVATSAMPSSVRVGILQNSSSITLVPSGDVAFKVGATTVATAHANETWTIAPTSAGAYRLSRNGTAVTTAGSPTAHLVASWNWNGGVSVRVPTTGYTYRWGPLELNTTSSGSGYRLRAILVISPFDRYLYGLGEVPSSWHSEALKAQVLAARTYAVEKIRRVGQNRAGCNCALYASTIDQAYVGYAKETGAYGSKWVAAVNAVANQLILYGGKPIQAYYSSSDGGATENNENVWGGSPIAYLRGVRDDGDTASPHHTWSITLSGDQMQAALNARSDTAVGGLVNVETLAPYGTSGRVLSVVDADSGGVRITGSGGTKRVSGARLQSILGLKSTLFRITRIADYPAGVVASAPAGTFLIGTNRTRSVSAAALASRMPPGEVVRTPSTSVTGLSEDAVPFRDGTILLDPQSRYWFVSAGQRRPFESASQLTSMGYKAGTALRVADTDLDLLPAGAAMDPSKAHPDGTLILDGSGYWWLRNGKRHNVKAALVLSSWRLSTTQAVPASSLDKALPDGGWLQVRDGTLVKGDTPSVYLISNGRRLPFSSATAFNGLGFQWSNVRPIGDAILKMHPAGTAIGTGTPPPPGVLLRFAGDPSNNVWRSAGTTRRWVAPVVLGTIAHAGEVVTYAPAQAVRVPPMGVLRYREGTVLRSPSGGLYLQTAGKLVAFRSGTDFNNFGLSPSIIRKVGWHDIGLHVVGGTIDPRSASPEGALVVSGDGKLWWIRGGKRCLVTGGFAGPVAYSHGLRTGEAMKMNGATSALATGDPVKLRDGSLVKGSGSAVYLISGGLRRPFASTASLAALGFSWSNVRTVPDGIVSMHPLGSAI